MAAARGLFPSVLPEPVEKRRTTPLPLRIPILAAPRAEATGPTLALDGSRGPASDAARALLPTLPIGG